jgi:hypothetical protein
MLLVLSLHKRLCISFVRIAHARNMHSWIAIEVKLWEGGLQSLLATISKEPFASALARASPPEAIGSLMR